MQGFNPHDPTHSVTLRFPTDTQTPQPVIPIYQFHTLHQPFCCNPHCACHQNQGQIAVLLEAIKQGEMTLREAADFADGKML
jgi:hypothetical protein